MHEAGERAHEHRPPNGGGEKRMLAVGFAHGRTEGSRKILLIMIGLERVRKEYSLAQQSCN